MSTIESIALIVALALHHPWMKDRLDRINDCKRPAIWLKRDGLWYGWDFGFGSCSRRRLFRWPFTNHSP